MGSLVVDGRGKGTMAALAEILPNNLVFVGGKELVEGLADKLEREEVDDAAMGEDDNLDLDWEAPRGGRRMGLNIGQV